MKRDRIGAHLEACLEDVRVSDALHNKIIHRAASPEPRRVSTPRRLAAVIIAALLMLGTAAAVTISELVRQELEPVGQMETDGQPGAWNQTEKLAIIGLMRDWDFDLDKEKLARLDDTLPPEEAELLTYEIIWDCIGERLQAYWRSQGIPADQPEEFPLSSSYALYEALWLMKVPDADAAQIRASYEEWQAQLHTQAAAQSTETPVPDADPRYAALLKSVDSYMADAMSMSTRERSIAVITAELNEAETAWQVVISVKGSLLREETRMWFHQQYQYGHTAYDAETDVYSYPYVFTADGRSGDASVLEEYEWRTLIPTSAYPPMPARYADYPYFDAYKQFLYSSAAQKAAFSRQYKPVIDAWLQEHPAFSADLEAGNDPLYLITRHQYSTPPEDYIQQDTALRIAIMHCITLRPDVTVDQLMNRCHHIVYYDVCDPARPLWKLLITWDADSMLPEDPIVDFMVIIDPATGEVVADHRTISYEEALHW